MELLEWEQINTSGAIYSDETQQTVHLSLKEEYRERSIQRKEIENSLAKRDCPLESERDRERRNQ